jgi:hypothetical protein
MLDVAQKLAQAIVRDGEGATKFITVRVEGGKTSEECRQVAYAIAHSPLVKTAFFASDPTWAAFWRRWAMPASTTWTRPDRSVPGRRACGRERRAQSPTTARRTASA